MVAKPTDGRTVIDRPAYVNAPISNFYRRLNGLLLNTDTKNGPILLSKAERGLVSDWYKGVGVLSGRFLDASVLQMQAVLFRAEQQWPRAIARLDDWPVDGIQPYAKRVGTFSLTWTGEERPRATVATSDQPDDAPDAPDATEDAPSADEQSDARDSAENAAQRAAAAQQTSARSDEQSDASRAHVARLREDLRELSERATDAESRLVVVRERCQRLKASLDAATKEFVEVHAERQEIGERMVELHEALIRARANVKLGRSATAPSPPDEPTKPSSLLGEFIDFAIGGKRAREQP